MRTVAAAFLAFLPACNAISGINDYSTGLEPPAVVATVDAPAESAPEADAIEIGSETETEPDSGAPDTAWAPPADTGTVEAAEVEADSDPPCIPKSCVELGYQCGARVDNCGKPIACGTCESGSCSSTGTCCAGLACGGSCCPSGAWCGTGGKCCTACVAGCSPC